MSGLDIAHAMQVGFLYNAELADDDMVFMMSVYFSVLRESEAGGWYHVGRE